MTRRWAPPGALAQEESLVWIPPFFITTKVEHKLRETCSLAEGYVDSLREHLHPDKLKGLDIAEFGSLLLQCLPGTSHGVGQAAGNHGGVSRNLREFLPLAVGKSTGWSEEYRQTPLYRSLEQQGDKEGRRRQLPAPRGLEVWLLLYLHRHAQHHVGAEAGSMAWAQLWGQASGTRWACS